MPTEQKPAAKVPAKQARAVLAAAREMLEFIAAARGPAKPLHVWAGPEELLLSMATPVVAYPRTVGGMRPLAAKECYRNAFVTTLDFPTLVYTEGFAMAPGLFPMHHAWVTHAETGKIFDPTWAAEHSAKPVVYLGLKFSRGFMTRNLEASQNLPGVFENDYRTAHLILRGGLIIEEGLVVDWGCPVPF